MAISKLNINAEIALMDPADPPDISQIKNAFTTVQTKINLVIDDINKSLKVVSDATDYVEVAQ